MELKLHLRKNEVILENNILTLRKSVHFVKGLNNLTIKNYFEGSLIETISKTVDVDSSFPKLIYYNVIKKLNDSGETVYLIDGLFSEPSALYSKNEKLCESNSDSVFKMIFRSSVELDSIDIKLVDSHGNISSDTLNVRGEYEQ